MPTKRNKAGQQQPYVPEGHGDASGEYAEHGTGSNQNYVSPDDVKRQLGYQTEQLKPESTLPKDVENKLNGTKQDTSTIEKFKNDIYSKHKFTEEEKNRVEETFRVANKECIEHIENLQNVEYRTTKAKAFFQPATNSVNLAKDDWTDEMRPIGEVYFHEYGHALNYNSKLAHEMLETLRSRYAGKFEVMRKAPASSSYISEKYKISLQDMLKEEYKTNINAVSLKKEIEQENNKTINNKLIETIGENNYNAFYGELEKIQQYRDLEEKKLDDEMKEKRDLLYSNRISFTEFKPMQDDVINRRHQLWDNIDKQKEEASVKYGNILKEKAKIKREVEKETNAKYASLSDVVAGANKGNFDLTGWGHGKRYWGQTVHTRGDEFFAEAFSAKATNPKCYEIFNKYFPKTMEIFEEILKRSK